MNPWTGSWYQPEREARLINLIDLQWLENKLLEQLCLSDHISLPRSQKAPSLWWTGLCVCFHLFTCIWEWKETDSLVICNYFKILSFLKLTFSNYWPKLFLRSLCLARLYSISPSDYYFVFTVWKFFICDSCLNNSKLVLAGNVSIYIFLSTSVVDYKSLKPILNFFESGKGIWAELSWIR